MPRYKCRKCGTVYECDCMPDICDCGYGIFDLLEDIVTAPIKIVKNITKGISGLFDFD